MFIISISVGGHHRQSSKQRPIIFDEIFKIFRAIYIEEVEQGGGAEKSFVITFSRTKQKISFVKDIKKTRKNFGKMSIENLDISLNHSRKLKL